MVVPNTNGSPLIWSVGVELGGMPKLSAMEHLGLPFIRTVAEGSTIPVYLGVLNPTDWSPGEQWCLAGNKAEGKETQLFNMREGLPPVPHE